MIGFARSIATRSATAGPLRPVSPRAGSGRARSPTRHAGSALDANCRWRSASSADPGAPEPQIQHTASLPESAFLRALEEGKLLGARTGSGGKVYFPPGKPTRPPASRLDEFIELPDKGTVTTFAIINIPFAGQRIKPPYVAAYVLLDGADIPFLHLVTEIDAADVRMGMRVEAVWKPREEWGLGIDNIDYFRPTGEPDADYDTYKHHQ